MSLGLAKSITTQKLGITKALKALAEEDLSDAEFSKKEKAIHTDRKYWNEGWTMLKVFLAHHNASVSARSLEKHFFWVTIIYLFFCHCFSLIHICVLIAQIFNAYMCPDGKETFRTRLDPRFAVSAENVDLVNIYTDVMWALATLSDYSKHLDEFISRITYVQLTVGCLYCMSTNVLTTAQTIRQLGRFHSSKYKPKPVHGKKPLQVFQVYRRTRPEGIRRDKEK